MQVLVEETIHEEITSNIHPKIVDLVSKASSHADDSTYAKYTTASFVTTDSEMHSAPSESIEAELGSFIIEVETAEDHLVKTSRSDPSAYESDAQSKGFRTEKLVESYNTQLT